MRFWIVLSCLWMSTFQVSGQFFGLFGGKKSAEVRPMLLTDRAIQIGTNDAINHMYNANYYAAERDFKWLIVKYPDHPIGFFLLGLNEWWRIVPDINQTKYDEACHQYMDQAISKAERLFDQDERDREAAFFLAAAYAFKGRLYSERERWVKAAWAGKQAMKYLDKSRGEVNINPELIFGDGLYNYYSKWIHETYPSLKPLLTFFRKGDKNLGIQQLENVANNAFYTRMEARYFLIQIYSMEGKHTKSLNMARTMHGLYPNNAFFHRFAARESFILSQFSEAERYAQELLDRLDRGIYGYGPNDGRYASYILGYIAEKIRLDVSEARIRYLKVLTYAQQNQSEDSGYAISARLALAGMDRSIQDWASARQHYEAVLREADKKSASYEKAKKGLAELKAEERKSKRGK
ncbi:MAG: tetratricopeptide repeat protein [Spirosomataceae bacterium]